MVNDSEIETNYSTVGVTTKGSRYTVPRCTKYAEATIDIRSTDGDRDAAAKLVCARVRQAFIERFGPISWELAGESYAHSTTSVTYVLRVEPWVF